MCVQVHASVSQAMSCSDSDDEPLLAALSSARQPPGGEGDTAAAHSSAHQLFDALALQAWILLACQDTKGLRDKPGKRPDFYHTCYCLSGLAACQAYSGLALGPAAANSLPATDPRINVRPEQLRAARDFFALEPVP